MTRVAAIILQNDGIVLIERKIYDERYYVFPGGSIEKGESFLRALKRELYEELGYKLFSSKLIIRYQRKYNTEYYFLVTTAGLKEFYGAGIEYEEIYQNLYGTFTPQIIPLKNIHEINIKPIKIKEILLQFLFTKWPSKTINVKD